MTVFWCFGDSFVVGEQDDEHTYPSWDQRIREVKNEVSFVSHIARHHGWHLENHAERGSGNWPQLDRLTSLVLRGQISSDDQVMFGMTTFTRDRLCLIGEYGTVLDPGRGECMISRNLALSEPGSVLVMDYVYVMSVLEQISQRWNIPVRCLHLWDCPLDSQQARDPRLSSEIKIGHCQGTAVTTVDMINDTWGRDWYHPIHTELKIPKDRRKYYTRLRHPSVLGHHKISQWLLSRVYT